MKKILGIIGSPRRLGNCEIMIKQIHRSIPVPHELTLIRLAEFDILPCRGCYQCLFSEAGCPLEDDLHRVLHAVMDADAILLAAPAYFLGPNAVLKRLIDRGLSFYAHVERLWGKPAVGVGIAGIEGKEGYTLLGIESFLKLLLTEIKSTAVIYGALPGEIFLDERNRDTAADLATALFAAPLPKKEPCCPLCGGETFRFLGGNRVRCMLCSNTGTVALSGGRPVFTIETGGHELFLSKEGVLRHRDWLRGMKARFVEQKNTLRDITTGYRRDGSWLKP